MEKSKSQPAKAHIQTQSDIKERGRGFMNRIGKKNCMREE
jgi:hypothetical protein